jgi:DNA-binding MarR family transcriptional regulator
MNKSHPQIDDMFVTVFEMIAQVVRVLRWNVAKNVSLSPIQIRFLLYLANAPKERCRVSNLAQEFSLTMATVSDAVNTLIKKKLVAKEQSQKDLRVFALRLSGAGNKMARKLCHWADILKATLKNCSKNEKKKAIMLLMNVIKLLQQKGVIEASRMHITCSKYRMDMLPDRKHPHSRTSRNTSFAIDDWAFERADQSRK